MSGAVLGGIAATGTVTAVESADRFVVDVGGKVSEKDVKDAENAGLEILHRLDPVGILVVRGAESDVEGLTGKYAPDTVAHFDLPVETIDVDDVDLDQEDATDEPLYPFQWDKQVQNIPDAHEITRGEGTRVSVIDTGVDATHPDLSHAVNTDLSRNFTDDGGDFTDVGDHGTHVSGIVAADDENDVGVVGTAPGTDLVACRVFSDEGGATFGDVLAAMVYSAEIGCDAANLSLGAYPISRKGLGSFYGKMLNSVTTFANKEGTLLSIAAGNDSADLQHDGRVCQENEDGEEECFPAISLPNEAAQAVSVSATGPIGFMWGDEGLEDPFHSPSFYTNFGTNAIDLGAPGGDADLDAIGTGVDWFLDLVLSTVPGGYGWKAGTSMAAPQVTGAAALVKSADPSLNANQVRQRLKNAAEVPEEFDKTFYGGGFLDPAAALQD